MFSTLLQPEIQQYILEHTGTPAAQLALQKNPFPEVPFTDIINQVAARQKAKDKLPTWYGAQNIIYPSKISVEQTSSEATAAYKANLVSGNSLIDLTGGFGIDDYYFAKNINRVTHCEINGELSAIAAHNFKILGADNITCANGDSLDVVTKLNDQWDWMYADPSRRSDSKGKVFMLQDCLPNVPALQDTYFKYTDNLLIKTAPLLDITAGMGELQNVKAIHIVAVANEVKEILWHLQKSYTGTVALVAANLSKSGTEIFTTSLNGNAQATYSLPQKYLYEPNSAIMKSGAFDDVSLYYTIDKLHKHSQLYTSNALLDFPGRSFIIDEVIPYQKAEMKAFVEGKKMNVTARNFPLPVQELQKKWKIKDGGSLYAFFTTNINNEKIVLLCSKA